MSFVQNYPQQPRNDLRVDVAYRENFGAEAINSKYAGVLPDGVYHGFDVTVKGDGAAFEVEVGSGGSNVALTEVKHPTDTAIAASMTSRMPEGMFKTLSITKGVQCFVVLEVFFKSGQQLGHEDKSYSELKVLTDLSSVPDYTSYLTLATVNVPAEAPAITEEHITSNRKVILTTENVEASNPLPDTYDQQYVVATGTGALAGKFSLYDTYTGGFVNFTALCTKNGEYEISVHSGALSLIRSIGLYENNGAMELRVSLDYAGIGGTERMFVDFRAFDGHNAAQLGWRQVFTAISQSVGEKKTSIDLIREGTGSDSGKTFFTGIGTTSELREGGQALSDRYLGKNAKAVSAGSADSSGTATVAKNSEKLGKFPASFFGINWFDLSNSDYEGLYADITRDPDTLKDPVALIKHAKMPNNSKTYIVFTVLYGSAVSALRIQFAIPFEESASFEDNDFDEFLSSAQKRWLAGSFSAPKKTNWSSKVKNADEAEHAKDADFANTANNAHALGELPSRYFAPCYFNLSSSQYLNFYPALATDPNTLRSGGAVIQHANMPDSTKIYLVETKFYGSDTTANRHQVARQIHPLPTHSTSERFERYIAGSTLSDPTHVESWKIIRSKAAVEEAVTITVGESGDFSKLTDAVKYAMDTYAPTFLDTPTGKYDEVRESEVTILILASTVLSEGLVFTNGVDAGFIRIQTEGVIEVDTAGLVYDSESSRYWFCNVSRGAKAPRFHSAYFTMSEKSSYRCGFRFAGAGTTMVSDGLQMHKAYEGFRVEDLAQISGDDFEADDCDYGFRIQKGGRAELGIPRARNCSFGFYLSGYVVTWQPHMEGCDTAITTFTGANASFSGAFLNGTEKLDVNGGRLEFSGWSSANKFASFDMSGGAVVSMASNYYDTANVTPNTITNEGVLING